MSVSVEECVFVSCAIKGVTLEASPQNASPFREGQLNLRVEMIEQFS